jgi:hypothetical protein
MERSRLLRLVRIAVTALSLTACVLLVALWVRSYGDLDGFVRAFGIAWASHDGAMQLVYPADLTADPNEELAVESTMTMQHVEPVPIKWTVDSYGFRFWRSWPLWIVDISYAYAVVLFGTVASAPWIRWSRRFSLRTLLIATALVAVALGIAVM